MDESDALLRTKSGRILLRCESEIEKDLPPRVKALAALCEETFYGKLKESWYSPLLREAEEAEREGGRLRGMRALFSLQSEEGSNGSCYRLTAAVSRGREVLYCFRQTFCFDPRSDRFLPAPQR